MFAVGVALGLQVSAVRGQTAEPSPTEGSGHEVEAAPRAPGAEARDGAPTTDAATVTDDAPEPVPGEGASALPGEPTATLLKLLVLDTAVTGVDPVVGRHVYAQIQETGAALGYENLGRAASMGAWGRLGAAYPPAPADLWRATYVAEAARGVFARVWAHDGRYVFELSVASLDGTGPFFARGDSGAEDLHAVVDRLVRQALPHADRWNEGGIPDAGGSSPSRPTSSAPIDEEFVDEDFETPEPSFTRDDPFEYDRAPQPPEEDPPFRRWHLVLQTEGAIGTSQDLFYNHLVGARVDYRITRDIILGAYLAYANLRGKGGRSDNLLTHLQIENRVHIIAASDITVPLRLAVGYVPFNGPFVRVAAGVNFPIAENLELGFDVLTPTFWVLPNRTAVSMNLAAEIVWRL